jgi:hypothetical protein
MNKDPDCKGCRLKEESHKTIYNIILTQCEKHDEKIMKKCPCKICLIKPICSKICLKRGKLGNYSLRATYTF